jgi:hypothetical protein
MSTKKPKEVKGAVVRVSRETYLKLVARQLEAVRAYKEKPSLGEIVAAALEKRT